MVQKIKSPVNRKYIGVLKWQRKKLAILEKSSEISLSNRANLRQSELSEMHQI